TGSSLSMRVRITERCGPGVNSGGEGTRGATHRPDVHDLLSRIMAFSYGRDVGAPLLGSIMAMRERCSRDIVDLSRGKRLNVDAATRYGASVTRESDRHG